MGLYELVSNFLGFVPESRLSFQKEFSACTNGVLHFIKKISPRVWSCGRMHGHVLSGPFEVLQHGDESAMCNIGYCIFRKKLFGPFIFRVIFS